MTSRCKPRPTNPTLYAEARDAVKARVRRWPSIYASSQVVQEYKRRGGTYSQSCGQKRGGLTKWFREKWVNVCYADLPPCGRQGAASSEAEYRRAFPKCRPLKVAQSMTAVEKKRACQRKRRVVRSQPKSSRKVVWVK